MVERFGVWDWELECLITRLTISQSFYLMWSWLIKRVTKHECFRPPPSDQEESRRMANIAWNFHENEMNCINIKIIYHWIEGIYKVVSTQCDLKASCLDV